jgi:hypothetical protein
MAILLQNTKHYESHRIEFQILTCFLHSTEHLLKSQKQQPALNRTNDFYSEDFGPAGRLSFLRPRYLEMQHTLLNNHYFGFFLRDEIQQLNLK